MLGGVALVIFGAGSVLSNPTVRRYLGQVGLGSYYVRGAAGLGTVFPFAVHVRQPVGVRKYTLVTGAKHRRCLPI